MDGSTRVRISDPGHWLDLSDLSESWSIKSLNSDMKPFSHGINISSDPRTASKSRLFWRWHLRWRTPCLARPRRRRRRCWRRSWPRRARAACGGCPTPWCSSAVWATRGRSSWRWRRADRRGEGGDFILVEWLLYPFWLYCYNITLLKTNKKVFSPKIGDHWSYNPVCGPSSYVASNFAAL